MVARARTSVDDPTIVAALCALISALAAAVAALASQDGWFRTSALVKMAGDEPLASLARAADPRFAFVSSQAHYDGVYYYAIARDPFARGTAHTLIDQAPYRYGHPLHGWLAGLLSFGSARVVPTALFVLSLGGMALAGWAVSRICAGHGRSPWTGLVVAVCPGLLFAATVSTTETLGAGLVVGALLAWHNDRRGLAGVLLVLCCLDKEQYVTVPIGIAVWEFVRARRRAHQPPAMAPDPGLPDTSSARGRWPIAATMAVLAAGPVLLALWYGYVHATLHAWPFSYESGNLGPPVTGWLETFKYGKALSDGSFEQSQIGAITAPVLIGLAALLLGAACVAIRVRTVLDAPLLGMVAITACQGWRTLLYPHEIFRTPAVVTLLAILVILVRPRREPRPAWRQPRPT